MGKQGSRRARDRVTRVVFLDQGYTINTKENVRRKYILVNKRITNGLNKHIVIKGSNEKRKWKLLYPEGEDAKSIIRFITSYQGSALPT